MSSTRALKASDVPLRKIRSHLCGRLRVRTSCGPNYDNLAVLKAKYDPAHLPPEREHRPEGPGRLSMLLVLHIVSLGAFLSSVLLANPSAAQTEPVTYHDLSAMATWPLGNMQVKGATGQSGSFAIAQMPPGVRGRTGNGHHHMQEQIVIGLSGSPIIGIDGVAYRVGTYGAVVTPPNAEHFNINGLTTGPSTFIEFQPVLRSDWFPPHKPYTAPRSPVPAPVSSDERVFEDFDSASGGWRSESNGSRSKTLSGRNIRLTVWDLSMAKSSADLRPQSEQFIYVLEGYAEMIVGSARREITPQMLAVVSPAAKDIRLRSVGKGRTLVALFESTTP
jgi:mannose-6-phosphate isomerase-like protein (cupin superfamily)